MATKFCNPDLGSGDDDGSSEANAFQDLSAAIAAISGGDLLYVKKTSSRHDDGALSMASGINGSATALTIVEGYGTTPGDNVQFQYAEKIDIDAKNFVLRNFDIEMSSGDVEGVLFIANNIDGVSVHNCRVYNTNTGNFPAILASQSAVFTNCEIIADGNITTTGRGALEIDSGDSAVVHGCSIRGSKGIGVLANAVGIAITNNIFYAAPNRDMKKGIEADLQISAGEVRCFLAQGNSMYNVLNMGIDFRELPDFDEKSVVVVANNLIWGDGGAEGIHCNDSATTVGPIIINNAIGNMGGASENVASFAASVAEYGTIDLTADPFVDGANGDFRLNGTAGGGAACRSAANPTTFPGESFTNKLDIGAVGHTGLVERISVG